jgi:hypothetical protein
MSKNEVITTQGKAVNPYAKGSAVDNASGGQQVEAHRAAVQTMLAFEVAKRFPRQMMEVAEVVLSECQRPALAEKAEYSYPKGKELVSGPTIRLLEACARAMGNMEWGWKVVEQTRKKTVILAEAYDLQTNTRRYTQFEVPHWRDTNSGGYSLEGKERDIYELCANMAMRRVRSCLEGLVPRELRDMAIEQCAKTQKANIDMSPEGISVLLDAFDSVGVNRKMIEASKNGTAIEEMTPMQIVSLRKNYRSIKDGLCGVEDIFDTSLAEKVGLAPPAAQEQPDLKAAVEQAQPEKTVTITGSTDQTHITAPVTDYLALENGIRKAMANAKTSDDLEDSLASELADDIEAIKTGRPGAWSTLKTAIDNRIAELKERA